MEYSRWLSLMSRLEVKPNQETYQALVSAYSEKHRHYHNITHIDAVLKHLDSVSSLVSDPVAVEIALWFHDAIYKTRSSTNELDSANWAVSFLKANGCDSAVSERVYALIMATLHTSNTSTNDESLIVDIDLSILGCPEPVYDRFERDVRKEYKWVPWFLYKKKRRVILEGLLGRERVYMTDFLF